MLQTDSQFQRIYNPAFCTSLDPWWAQDPRLETNSQRSHNQENQHQPYLLDHVQSELGHDLLHNPSHSSKSISPSNHFLDAFDAAIPGVRLVERNGGYRFAWKRMLKHCSIDYLKRETIRHTYTKKSLTVAHQTSLLAHVLRKCLRRHLWYTLTLPSK